MATAKLIATKGKYQGFKVGSMLYVYEGEEFVAMYGRKNSCFTFYGDAASAENVLDRIIACDVEEAENKARVREARKASIAEYLAQRADRAARVSDQFSLAL
jgi:hypothetical protein